MSSKPFNFYAVKMGRKPGIYESWEECFAQVTGYSNAQYKGFRSLQEAKKYLADFDGSHSDETKSPGSNPTNSQQVTIYTDGSSVGNPGPGGYAAVMIYGNHRKEVSGGYRLTTNNRMEIIAALVGLGMLRRSCSVVLYTDSKYLCDAMSNGWISRWQKNGWRTVEGKPVANIDLWQQLLEQVAKHHVNFEWVRGHSGTRENERCDELATQMATSKNLPIDFGYEKQFAEHPEG